MLSSPHLHRLRTQQNTTNSKLDFAELWGVAGVQTDEDWKWKRLESDEVLQCIR